MLKETHLTFPYPYRREQGKVRDIYIIAEQLIVLVATDRVSAFDTILPKGIPYKGQVLTQLAKFFLEQTAEICPNYYIGSPHPNVLVGHYTHPYPIEFVVRGYLCGHAWRVYASGQRTLCGNPLPEGLKKNDPLPHPILTPTTKSKIGHDEDISEEEILKSGIIAEEDYFLIKDYCFKLYEWGQQWAKQRGLILADTKYEFGYVEGNILLIDEVHTPDSSRYFYLDGYEERQKKGEPQPQLSKEFLREWLMEQGFQGRAGETLPEIPEEVILTLSQRYIEVYETLTGQAFEKKEVNEKTLQEQVLAYLKSLEER